MHETNKNWDPGTIEPYMRKGSTSCQEYATLVKLRQVHVRIRSVAPTIWSAHRSTHLCAAVPLTQGRNAPDSLRPCARNSGLQALRPIAPLLPSFYLPKIPLLSLPLLSQPCSKPSPVCPLHSPQCSLPFALCPLPLAAYRPLYPSLLSPSSLLSPLTPLPSSPSSKHGPDA